MLKNIFVNNRTGLYSGQFDMVYFYLRFNTFIARN